MHTHQHKDRNLLEALRILKRAYDTTSQRWFWYLGMNSELRTYLNIIWNIKTT